MEGDFLPKVGSIFREVDKDCLTARELSEKTGISTRRILRMAGDGRLPSYHIHKQRVFSLRALNILTDRIENREIET